SCGAKVRLPPESAGQTFRCPKCRNEFVAADQRAPKFGAAPDAGGRGVCPICQSAIAAGEVVLTCPDCGQKHHRECWAEVGGCSTYGCAQSPAVNKEE